MNFPVLRLALALGVTAPATFASLVLVSPLPFNGTGSGNVPTLLVIQQTNGQDTTEAGCQSFSNTGTSFSGGSCTGTNEEVQTSQSQVRSLNEAALGTGLSAANNFRIIFNANQTGGGNITLTSLVASFYSSGGTLLYQTSGVSCPGVTDCAFPNSFNGQGNSGFVFGLDTAQRDAAIAAGAFNSGTNLVGLSASATGTNAGGETFFLASANLTSDVPGVPEPSTYALVGFGAIALGLIGRKKRA